MEQNNQSLKTFNFPFLPGIEAVFGNSIINDFRRHIHNTFIIGNITEGERNITLQHKVTRIAENEIFILNPGQVHSCNSATPSGHSYRVLSVSPVFLQTIASQISEKPEKKQYFPKVKYQNSELSKNLSRLFNTIENPDSDLQVEAMIYSFTGFLLLGFSESPPEIHQSGEQKESIKRACNYICNNYSQNIYLKDLAEIACLSQFHFNRKFKKQMGITPHEYLNDFRISIARKLLSKSNDIADIAIQTGFFDQSHFSRIFKKTIGIPPGKFYKINK